MGRTLLNRRRLMCDLDVVLYDWIELTNTTTIEIHIPEFYTNEKYVQFKCRYLLDIGLIVPIRFSNANKTQQLVCGKNNNNSQIYISYSAWGGVNYANAYTRDTYTQGKLLEYTSIYNNRQFDASIIADGVLMPLTHVSNYNVQPFVIERVEVRGSLCKLYNIEVDGVINFVPGKKGLQTGIYDTLSHKFYSMAGVIVGND